MNELSSLANACIATTGNLHVVSAYIHIVPVILFIPLAFIVYARSYKSLPARIFLSFILAFSIWMLGDLATWNSTNPHLIYATWAFLDYVEIVFFTLGLYLIITLIRQKKLSISKELLLIAPTIIPLVFVIMGKSVVGFDYFACEALNNPFLTLYKFWLEIGILLFALIYIVRSSLTKQVIANKKGIFTVVTSLFLFLIIFGLTEYLASSLRDYTIHLYSLFILPVFLLTIIYAVFELRAFGFRVPGTPYLVIALIALIGGQLFLIESSSDQLIALLGLTFFTGLTLIFASLRRASSEQESLEVSATVVDPWASSTPETTSGPQSDKRSKILFSVLFILILLSATHLYWRSYVESDFIIEESELIEEVYE